MKRLFVEPYDPFVVMAGLMKRETQLNKTISLLLVLIVIPIVLGVIAHPAALAFLVVPLPFIGMYAEEVGAPYLIVHKRVRYHVSIFNDWYNREILDKHDLYREKVVEYLDYIRAGGEENPTVENGLSEWLVQAQRDIREEDSRREESAASMFHHDEELKAYREAKSKL